ncbi:ComEA family DNA-binding protein [Kocuria rosea]|uniref:ComEA family DNA-binding protein n=1 Tax=Kocuria rosea TaxID=1275 RepID=UPI001B866263|nr:ComEA family DNA-binding protein [Kocuria rosea]
MTGTVPRARRRANPTPPAPVVPPAPSASGATAAGAGPGRAPAPGAPAPGAPAPGAPAPAERLASLLAEARGEATGPGRAPSPQDGAPGAAPAHRRLVAARTRVPASLLLIVLAALAWLSWTVLGPGKDGGEVPETAGRPVLAEAELGGDQGQDTGQDPGRHGGGDTGREAGDGAVAGAGMATGPGTGPPGSAAAQPPAAGSTLHVHVTGEVARPGVVSLKAGARVVDAVEAAGGLTDAAVTESVNLAAPVTDGQQVLVPDTETAPVPAPGAPAPGAAAAPGAAVPPGVPGAPSGTGAPEGAAPGGTLNLNTATAAELETLPRVGPVLAGRIVEFRQKHGGFAAVADLDAVPGIGPALMESLGPLVSV